MGASLSYFGSLNSIPKATLDELQTRLQKESRESRAQFEKMNRAQFEKMNPKMAAMMSGTSASIMFPEPHIVSEGKTSKGWFMVIVERADVIRSGEDVLKRLSMGTQVIACFIEEHVMYSVAASWKDGKKIWSVVHDSNKGHRHIEAIGAVPPTYQAIYKKLASQPDDCDRLFDVPVETAASIIGFRR